MPNFHHSIQGRVAGLYMGQRGISAMTSLMQQFIGSRKVGEVLPEGSLLAFTMLSAAICPEVSGRNYHILFDLQLTVKESVKKVEVVRVRGYFAGGLEPIFALETDEPVSALEIVKKLLDALKPRPQVAGQV